MKDVFKFQINKKRNSGKCLNGGNNKTIFRIQKLNIMNLILIIQVLNHVFINLVPLFGNYVKQFVLNLAMLVIKKQSSFDTFTSP